jgi:hypothetical protein
LPKPSLFIASNFQLGNGGENMNGALSLRQPNGIVTKTASAESISSLIFSFDPTGLYDGSLNVDDS